MTNLHNQKLLNAPIASNKTNFNDTILMQSTPQLIILPILTIFQSTLLKINIFCGHNLKASLSAQRGKSHRYGTILMTLVEWINVG